MSAIFDPAAIERRIDESLAGTGGEGTAMKRSSLLTLVVVHPSRSQAGVAARLDYLFGRRPLRVIRIETGHSSPTTVDVSARCLPHASGDEVCFQEIVFYSGPDGRGMDGALWSPLVIRDVPAVLMWLERPEDLPTFLDRTDFAVDKCVIDLGADGTVAAGGTWPHVLSTMSKLARRFGPRADGPVPPVLSDLAWRALASLRSRIAGSFDPPAARELLPRLERVAISGLPPLAASLVVLWLASRLGWTSPKLESGGLEFARADGKPVSVRMPDVDGRFAIEFEAMGERPIVVSEGDGKGDAYAAACDEECLLAEIDHLDPDPAFCEILASAARFAGDDGHS